MVYPPGTVMVGDEDDPVLVHDMATIRISSVIAEAGITTVVDVAPTVLYVEAFVMYNNPDTAVFAWLANIFLTVI
jgi:hypothetical protein